MPVAGATRTILPLNEERCESAAKSFLCGGQKSVRCTCLWVRGTRPGPFPAPPRHGAQTCSIAMVLSVSCLRLLSLYARQVYLLRWHIERRGRSSTASDACHRPCSFWVCTDHCCRPSRTATPLPCARSSSVAGGEAPGGPQWHACPAGRTRASNEFLMITDPFPQRSGGLAPSGDPIDPIGDAGLRARHTSESGSRRTTVGPKDLNRC